LLGDGDAFLDVLETHAPVVLGHDRAREGIPRRQTLTGLDHFAVADGDGGAVRNLVTLALAAVVVINDDFAGTGDRDALAVRIRDVAQADREAHRTGGLGFDRAGHRGARRRTTDVERTHRELRTRFADRLG